MTTELYGVYLAAFPFLETSGRKIRPVIVVSYPNGPFNIVIIPISSKESREPIDIPVKNWRAAGLIKSSIARIHRLTSFLEEDIVSQLGKLDSADIQELKISLKSLLKT